MLALWALHQTLPRIGWNEIWNIAYKNFITRIAKSYYKIRITFNASSVILDLIHLKFTDNVSPCQISSTYFIMDTILAHFLPKSWKDPANTMPLPGTKPWPPLLASRRLTLLSSRQMQHKLATGYFFPALPHTRPLYNGVMALAFFLGTIAASRLMTGAALHAL